MFRPCQNLGIGALIGSKQSVVSLVEQTEMTEKGKASMSVACVYKFGGTREAHNRCVMSLGLSLTVQRNSLSFRRQWQALPTPHRVFGVRRGH